MGGRGSSSASSAAFTTGDRKADKIVADALSKHKNDMPKTKLSENIAKRTLERSNGDPIGEMKAKAKQMVASHERDLREVANFKADIARREAEIARHAENLKAADKGSKIVNKDGVEKVTKGNTYESLQLAQARRENAINQAYRDYGARKKAIKNFEQNFAKEMDSMARSASLANNYKKRKRK